MSGSGWPRWPRATATLRSATLRGEVRSTLADRLGLIFVGLFAEPVPEGQPVSCTVLHHAGPYTLSNVPHGTWYLLAHSVAAGLELAVSGLSASEQASLEEPASSRPLCVGSHGPLKIGPDTVFRHADVTLNAVPSSLDPRVPQALLDLRSADLTVGTA